MILKPIDLIPSAAMARRADVHAQKMLRLIHSGAVIPDAKMTAGDMLLFLFKPERVDEIRATIEGQRQSKEATR